MNQDQLNCPHCDAFVARIDRYCSSCGYALSKQCVACKGTLHFTQRYCKQCGAQAIGSEHEAATQGPDLTVPAGLLASRGAQNAFATIMFLDIKGSSGLIERLDPEDAADVLDEIHGRYARYIGRFGGHIIAFQGDGFQAIFGAPEAREDHATRALLAAVAIREEVLRQPPGRQVTLRIGVHSGDVHTRMVRTDFNTEFDAMGLAVHVAKRLEESAEDNGIHASYVTFNLARHQFDFESRGATTLRGLTHPMQTFRVTRFRPVPETAARGDAAFSPVVGRDFELELLSRSLSLALGGRGQIAVLLGEAGIGKSRLALELAEMARSQGAVVLIHEEVMQGLARSYSSILRLLRLLEGVAATDAERSGELLYDRHDLLYGSAQASADASTGSTPTDIDEELRMRLITAVEAVSTRRLLAVIIDDAQWMDAESQQILVTTFGQIADLRTMLVVCARDFNSLPRFEDASNIAFVRVGPLQAEASSMLFRSVARDAAAAPGLEAAIATMTGGNPLFVEELALAASSGEFTVAGVTEPKADSDIEPGGRVRSILLERVQHLDHEARLLLRCAALVQFDCTEDLLADIASIDDAARATRIVQDLHGAGYLRRSRAGDRLLYGMRHSLQRQIIGRSIVRPDLRRLHRRIRDVLGAASGLNVSSEVLAHHAMLAEDWARASDDWRTAGMHALDASLYRHAATCFERALEATDREADEGRRSERQDAIRLLLRSCLAPMGEYKKLYFHLNQVSHHLSNDDNSRLQMLVTLAHVENICGNVRFSRRKAVEARRLADKIGQRGAQVAATYFLAQALEFSADYADCIALSSATLDELLRSERHERFHLTGTGTVLFASLLSHAHAFRGNAAEAERNGALAVAIADETQRPFDLGVAHFGLGWGRFVLGDLTGAMPCFLNAIDHIKDQRLRLLESMVDCRLRYLRIVVGGERLQAVDPEEACNDATEMPHIWSWCSLMWAMAEMHQGNLDRSTQIVSDVIALARTNHYRGVLAWATNVLADIKYRSRAVNCHLIGYRARQLADKTGLAWKFADAEWMQRDTTDAPMIA